MNTVASNHYSGIKRFLPVIILVLFGLGVSLLWQFFMWPFTIGGAVALVIWILSKQSPDEDKKFFHGLSLTFLVSAVMLGAFGVVSVAVGLL